jgi:predicted membrane chloride channel (bestrophin family)
MRRSVVKPAVKPQLSVLFDQTEKPKHLLSYDGLEKIEIQRRLLLKHTKSANAYVFITSFAATVLPSVFSDFLFWIAFAVYGVVRYLAWHNKDIFAKLPIALLQQVSVVSGFLTFFLVFFSSQSYNRYFLQYNKLMLAKGTIFNLANLTAASLPRHKALRLVRWLNTAFLLAFVGLSQVYEEHNFFLPLVDMYKLLTPSELDRVQTLGVDSHGIAYREVLAWVVREVSALQKERAMPDKIGDSIWKEVVKLRDHLEVIFDMDDQPIPFVYVHLIYLISTVYLPLMAYTLAYNVAVESQSPGVELVGVACLFLTCLFVLGLRDLGFILQDPFGEDLQDLSVMHYVTYTVQMSRRILEGQARPPCSEEEETELDSQRPDLGPGYHQGHVEPLTPAVSGAASLSLAQEGDGGKVYEYKV